MNLDCGKCRVRDWRLADKPSLLRLADNRNVARNLAHRFPHPYTEADADAWFVLLANKPQPTAWAIDVGGEAVGGIGIDVGEGIYAKTARFGYWLGEPLWGQGIMTAAVRATADFALDHFDLVRLEAPVFATRHGGDPEAIEEYFIKGAEAQTAVVDPTPAGGPTVPPPSDNIPDKLF